MRQYNIKYLLYVTHYIIHLQITKIYSSLVANKKE